MIFRTCVWFNPFHAPISTEIIAVVINILGFINSWNWYRIDRGATFCHVSSTRPTFSLIP